MPESSFKKFHKFERVLLGLPRPLWTPIACHWQITGDLTKLGITAVEIQFLHTLLPEMLSPHPYIALIHSDLLDLADVFNSDRAALIRLAALLPQNFFAIWDKSKAWLPSDVALPENLEIWSENETDAVTQKLIEILEQGVHENGHRGLRRRKK